MTARRACQRCLARTWLVERLAANLEPARGRIQEVLALSNERLIAAVAGAAAERVRAELLAFDAEAAHAHAARHGVEMICRCDADYPDRLRGLVSPPAVLHVAGGVGRCLHLLAAEPVALVGSRRGSQYGLDVARALGRGLACAGIPVISGMANGIDSAAHSGALISGGLTVAVLPAGAHRAYPPAKRALHAEIVAVGAAVSELPGADGVRRWMFPARNRLIAALSAMTVVVEASERSGALVTAANARSLHRRVGAVPGRVTSSLSSGTNELLVRGADVVRNPQDVLDLLYGQGAHVLAAPPKPPLAPELDLLLAAVAEGHDTAGALERAGFPAEQHLAALASLELAGYVRREPGGRFSVTA
ncbi:MAG: DNA-protecting protein DprA [Solirubrobacterales bacterium]|nr:DNA-protecting protein DprA [Solirubrobacterales bacterium]